MQKMDRLDIREIIYVKRRVKEPTLILVEQRLRDLVKTKVTFLLKFSAWVSVCIKVTFLYFFVIQNNYTMIGANTHQKHGRFNKLILFFF